MAQLHFDLANLQVNIDKLNLQCVIQNLIENAIKHNRKEVATVHVDLKKLDDILVINIKDNGPDIDPKYHDKIFGVFQTLSADEENKSTGIGLSLIKKIMKENGEEINLESTLGAGTEFIVKWKC